MNSNGFARIARRASVSGSASFNPFLDSVTGVETAEVAREAGVGGCERWRELEMPARPDALPPPPEGTTGGGREEVEEEVVEKVVEGR